MAVTNPTAVRFANERIRVAADKLMQAYNFAKATQNEWWNTEISAGVTLATGIPNDGAEQIMDGADVDGRSVIFGDDVHNIMTRLTELVTEYEAIVNAKLNTIAKVSVNPTNNTGP